MCAFLTSFTKLFPLFSSSPSHTLSPSLSFFFFLVSFSPSLPSSLCHSPSFSYTHRETSRLIGVPLTFSVCFDSGDQKALHSLSPSILGFFKECLHIFFLVFYERTKIRTCFYTPSFPFYQDQYIFFPCLEMIPSKSQQNILAVFSSALGFSVTNCINIFQTGEFEGFKLFFLMMSVF